MAYFSNIDETYTVTSATGETIKSCIAKKEAVALVRELGGPANATFKRDCVSTEFAQPEQFTVREWAKTFRNAGYMRK